MTIDPKHKKWLVIAAKLLVFGLIAWGLRGALVKAFADLGKHHWTVHPGWLVASALFYLVGMIPAGIFWHRVLRAAEQDVALGETLRTFFVSQLGKYAPGKALVLVMRAAMLRRPTVDTTVVTASVFFETFNTMASGSLVAAIALFAWYPELSITLPLPSGETFDVRMSYAAVGLAILLGYPAIPYVFRQIVAMLGVNKISPSAARLLGAIPLRLVAAGWLMTAVGWIIQGLSLGAILQSLGADADLVAEWPRNTAAVSLAVVAGFVTLIPGGLGVRELVLIPLLATRYGESTALVSAILLRIVWLVAEVIVSVILYLGGARRLPLVALIRASRNSAQPLAAVEEAGVAE